MIQPRQGPPAFSPACADSRPALPRTYVLPVHVFNMRLLYFITRPVIALSPSGPDPDPIARAAHVGPGGGRGRGRGLPPLEALRPLHTPYAPPLRPWGPSHVPPFKTARSTRCPLKSLCKPPAGTLFSGRRGGEHAQLDASDLTRTFLPPSPACGTSCCRNDDNSPMLMTGMGE